MVPRGTDHSSLNEGELVFLYCIQSLIQVDRIFMLHDHMMKAKRLTNFYLPYVVFISKFLEYFEVDVEDELQETTGAQNHICRLNLHKMGFTKVNNN